MTAHRQLAPDRTLIVSRLDGLMVLGIRGPGDVPISGPLAVRQADAAAFLAALTQATGGELAADMERVRAALRASPGLAGYDRLRAALVGMSMNRRRAAVSALRAAGEIDDQGERGRPRLYCASRPPEPAGVALSPCPLPERAESAPYDASRAPAMGEADVTSPGDAP